MSEKQIVVDWNTFNGVKRENSRLREQLKTAREDLGEYGRHRDECCWSYTNRKCNCGLDQALSTLNTTEVKNNGR